MSEQYLTFSLTEVCHSTGLTEAHVTEFVSHGVVSPSGHESSQWEFDSHAVFLINKACRLRRELDLDWAAITLIVDLLEQREQLEQQNRQLQQQLSRFLER